jgi:3-hydroxyisobutyrate dehydrogenase
MGQPMAKNLITKRFPLIVYNRTKSKTSELAQLGARVADTPQDLAKQQPYYRR